MTEVAKSNAGHKRSSWLRKLAVVAGSLAFLIVVLYFVATSSAFVKSFVLPRVGKALGADLTVANLSLSPFSQVILQNVRVHTRGTEPLLTADEANIRYDLFAILRGDLKLQEVSLVGPQVHIVTEADGTSNLDPLLKRELSQPGRTAESVEPIRLDARNLSLKNANLRMITKQKDGATQVIAAENMTLALDQLRNGGHGTAKVSADLKFEQTPGNAKDGGTDRAQAKLSGDFELGLDPQLTPASVKGSLRFNLAQADGAFKDAAGLGGTLLADASPAEIRQFSLHFERAGKSLGNLQASGPFNLEKRETRLKVEVQSIDRQVLNLFGAAHGWDFGDSILNASGNVEVTQNGSVIAANGNMTGSRVGVRQRSGATPPLDLTLAYQAQVNLDQKTAVVEKLSLTGKESQKDLLQVSLDRPMALNWGAAQASIPDSTLQLSLKDFSIPAWQSLIGTNAPGGRVDLQMSVQAQQNGKKLATKLTGSIQDLAARVGTNQIEQAQARFELSGRMTDLKMVDLDAYRFELLLKNQMAASSRGSAQLDLSKGELKLKSDSEASLPEVLKPFPVAGLSVSSGRIKSSATISQSGERRTASGQLELDGFSGSYSEYAFKDFRTSVDYDLDLAQNTVQIQRAVANFGQGGQPCGSLQISGRHNLTNMAGQATFSISQFNQTLMAPFLGAFLGNTRLVTVLLNAQGEASHSPNGESSVKGEIKLDNLVMAGPENRFPQVPFDARLQVQGSFRHPEIDVRQLVLDIRQGVKSAGHADVQGKFNLTNYAGSGSFTISDFDQTVLGLLLQPSLGENRLASAALSGNGSASFNAKGDSAVKAELKVANLVVEDPQRKLPRAPLSAEMQLDSSVRAQTVELRQFALKLSPTDRAQNQLLLQGRLDLSPTNAGPSQLTLQADSLDLTPYYELFAGTTSTNPTGAKPRAVRQAFSLPVQGASLPRGSSGKMPLEPAAKISAPRIQTGAQSAVPRESEPAPVTLPIQQLTAELKVNRCFLRDVALTNLQATAKLNRSEVALKPLQFALNGAPVSGSAILDLSVPGYKYDVALKADRVPLDPLASGFGTQSSGSIRGVLLADAQLRGAGVTGASLQRNLSGQISLNLTNLNLEIVGKKTKALLDPIALVLRVPELTLTPLEWVSAKADLGQGKINLSQFSVFSPAFFAQGQGTIRIAPDLTNSPLDIPVALALRRSLAEKARLVGAGTPTNAAYVQLPTFAKLAGTLGDPKTEIDKLVISGVLLQTAGSLPKVGEKTGNLLQGLGELLGGQRPPLGTNLPPGTNIIPASPANKPPRVSPLDLLDLLPRKKK
ncbi:MAG: AsmA family protein [Verrucomicrobia bacterium]|nr:AsmA family protein [Verrucomicrobiota bacterium]